MKKIIITGGLGFIGSHLVKLFLASNYKVLNIDKKTYASIKKINFSKKNYLFKKIDITNSKKLNNEVEKFKPDFLINCAAESHVDNSIINPKVFLETNVIGTFNCLESVLKLKSKCRFLQVSTDEVFGSLKKKQRKFNEKTSYNPQSPYSASKASADHLVRSYGNTYNIDYIITNCSNNFGPYQNPEKLIPKIIINCMRRKKIPIYGDGQNIREWIFVEDHCRGIKMCLEKGETKNTYLIGTETELSNLTIAKKITQTLSTKENYNFYKLVIFVEDRKGHDFRYAINSNKIKKKLKFKNQTKFEDGLRKTIEFYYKNYKKLSQIFSNKF
jgi:dTDP-glucose 4,6-dehydratase